MNSKEMVKNVIESKNGIAKVADMVNTGVSRQDIKKLYADGYIQWLNSEPQSLYRDVLIYQLSVNKIWSKM